MPEGPTTPYPISSLTAPAPGGRLSPERARRLREDLAALAAHRRRALAEIRGQA